MKLFFHRLAVMFILPLCLCFSSLPLASQEGGGARGSISNIGELFNFELENHKGSNRAYEQLLRNSQQLARVADSEHRARLCLALLRECRQLLQSVERSRARQVELSGLIDQAFAGKTLIPQEKTYLTHYLAKLKDIGSALDTMQGVLQRRGGELQNIMRNIPPPPQFTTRTGLQMELATLGKTPFYISRRPVDAVIYQAGSTGSALFQPGPDADAGLPPQTGITLDEAAAFCQWLSQQENFPFRLPELAELQGLSQELVQHFPVALWTRSRWAPADAWEELEACKRFGVTFYSIWDAHGMLSAAHHAALAVRELRSAAYSTLGFVVVTPAQTGSAIRYQKLLAELEQEQP